MLGMVKGLAGKKHEWRHELITDDSKTNFGATHSPVSLL
jgi:hypothetical protein